MSSHILVEIVVYVLFLCKMPCDILVSSTLLHFGTYIPPKMYPFSYFLQYYTPNRQYFSKNPSNILVCSTLLLIVCTDICYPPQFSHHIVARHCTQNKIIFLVCINRPYYKVRTCTQIFNKPSRWFPRFQVISVILLWLFNQRANILQTNVHSFV